MSIQPFPFLHLSPNIAIIQLMDFELSRLSDSIGVESNAEYGHSELNVRYLPDIIEERAANEKSCVQVLNHLIEKADTEILDLEDDLAILQSQLSWSEHEKLYEVCTSVFREKITSLSLSLQTLRKGYTHNNNALNADLEPHHEPVERIRDTITALLENYNSTEINKECCIVKADIEENGNTTSVTTSLGFSRNPDNKQIADSENQVPDSEIKGESNAVEGGIAVNGSEAIILSQQDCESKGGSEQCTLSASQAIIRWRQDCDGKGETEQCTPISSLPRGGVKVDFDENEPLAMVLYTPASKRKKVENPTRSRTGIAKKSSKTYFSTANSRLSVASEISGRNPELGRKKSGEKSNHPLHTNENPELALSAEMRSPSMSSHYRDLQVVTSVSEFTREKLEKMSRVDLMAVAKKQGLKNYYKTKKSILVEMILSKMGQVEWTPCSE